MRIAPLWPLMLMLATSLGFAEGGEAQSMLQAMQHCRLEPAALERLGCYDQLLSPASAGFEGALVKARFQGEAWTRATDQEKRRQSNGTELLITQAAGEHPSVVITTPAIGSVPPRPVLMFSCVDNITRMQVALTQALEQHDVAVTLRVDNHTFHSQWFVRENGMLLESSRGLSGIDEIRQLFGSKTLAIELNADSAVGKWMFDINGLEKVIKPLQEACHWAGEAK